MFQQIWQSLNPNAQIFIRMWIDSREINNFPHPAQEIIQVFEEIPSPGLFFTMSKWNRRQRNLWLLLTNRDINAYNEIVRTYSYKPTFAERQFA